MNNIWIWTNYQTNKKLPDPLVVHGDSWDWYCQQRGRQLRTASLSRETHEIDIVSFWRQNWKQKFFCPPKHDKLRYLVLIPARVSVTKTLVFDGLDARAWHLALASSRGSTKPSQTEIDKQTIPKTKRNKHDDDDDKDGRITIFESKKASNK